MKRLMLLSAFPIVLSGCVMLTQAKLNSEDETVWRTALEELSKSDAPLLAEQNKETADYGTDQVFNVAKDASYRVEVRKAAVELLAKKKKYDRLLDLYKLSLDQKWSEDISRTIAKAFASDEGMRKLGIECMFGDNFQRCETANALLKATPHGVERVLPVICGYSLDHPHGSANTFSCKWKVNGKDFERFDRRYDDFSLFCYFAIMNPSVDLSKRVLFNKNLTADDSKYGRPRYNITQLRKVVERISEKELRECLSKLREADPDKYWVAWSYCATSEEALKVWNSKADMKKRLYALGRVKDERVLDSVVAEMKKDLGADNWGKDTFGEAAIGRAIDAYENTAKLTQLAQDEALCLKLRERAFRNLLKRVCKNQNDENVVALTMALGSFDYTNVYGELFRDAQSAARKCENKTLLDAVRKSVECRVNEIVKDGLSVKDDLIVYKGIRLGMYRWEFDLLVSYNDLSDVGRFHDENPFADLGNGTGVGEFTSGECGACDDYGYVTKIALAGGAVKEMTGLYDTAKVEELKDEMSTRYSAVGGDTWIYSVKTLKDESDSKQSVKTLKDETDSKHKVIELRCNSKTLPRFKNRKANEREQALLKKEWIRKDGDVKGDLNDFYAGETKPQKGSVYVSGGWCRVNGIVMEVGKNGIVVGRKPIVNKTETKTIEKESSGYFLDKPKLVEKVKVNTDVTEFPVKLYIKMKGNFVVGQKCPEGKFRCTGEAKVGDQVLYAFEPYVTPKK